MKPGRIPSCPTRRCPPRSPRATPIPPPADAGIGPEVGLDHLGQRCGTQDRSGPVGATARQRGGEARDVAGGGVEPPGRRSGPVPVGDHLCAAPAQGVAGGQACADRRGTDEAGVAHPEGPEDALVEPPVEGCPGDVLDDLAECGEPVVGVREHGAGLRDHPQTTAVVLGRRRQRVSERHAEVQRPSLERPRLEVEQIAEVARLRDPGGVGEQVAQGGQPETGPRRDKLV